MPERISKHQLTLLIKIYNFPAQGKFCLKVVS